MIRCPQTGKPLPTGMAFTEANFKAITLSSNSVLCPHCGQMHVWDKKDAWLDGD